MSRSVFRAGPLPALVLASLLIASLLIAGCGQSGPEILPVTGVVTLDGKPLEQARVVFIPEKGRSAVGLTNASGQYKLQFNEERWGTLPGPHKVQITTDRPQTGGEGGQPLVPAQKELLPKKYHESTELEANVAPDKVTFDFALTSK